MTNELPQENKPKAAPSRDERFIAHVRRVYRSLLFPPFVIFLAILVVTTWTWRSTRNNVNRGIEAVIVSREDEIRDSLKQRLASYEQILLGGAGLFRSSDDVTAREWGNYVSTFSIGTQYPGVQSIGYLIDAPADKIEEIKMFMQNQGEPFAINPSGERSSYTPIIYLEPKTNAVGLDMSVDPVRKKALETARDTGRSTLTTPTETLLPNNSNGGLVFFLFTPQYKPGVPTDTAVQRQQAIEGYVYAGFKSQDFFNSLFRIANTDSNLGFRVSTPVDGMQKTFYQTPNYETLNSVSNHRSDKKTVELYGQTWTFEYVLGYETLASTQQRNGPWWVLIIGLTLGLLLCSVIYLLLKTRANELTMQKEKEVDIAKDELLSLASHQLRTPATTVKQYIGMVLQGFAGDISTTQRNLLQSAYAGNERQLYIINEMLHVAKVDAGRITLARKKCDIIKLVKNVVDELDGDIKASGHKLKTHYPKKPVILNIDEHMLRMAIENLLSNAIKYTPTGGKIEITVTTKGNRARVSIADNGVGIAADDIPKIYKLFTRLDNNLTETVSGTGVGLYLTKHLVELHHGRIHVESEPDKGSIFTISLPHRRI